MVKSDNEIIPRSYLKEYRTWIKQEYRFGETQSNTLIPIFTFFYGITIGLYSTCLTNQSACTALSPIYSASFIISIILTGFFIFRYPAFKEMNVLIHELNSAIIYYNKLKDDKDFYCEVKSIEKRVIKLMKKEYEITKINNKIKT